MNGVNLIFCRVLLRQVLADVRPLLPAGFKLRDAWVWTSDRKQWEFHGPDGFYWYGDADNAYDARAQGWQAWCNRAQDIGAATFHGHDAEGLAIYRNVVLS